MGGLFKDSGAINKLIPSPAALRIQDSAQGKVRPLGCGRFRIAANLIWCGGFRATAIVHQSPGQGGGKGGGGGGADHFDVTYVYSAYVAMGIMAGPISSVEAIFDQRGGINTLASFNATLFDGDYAQLPWGYLSTNFPAQALNYRGLAYVAFEPFSLGASPDLPNLTFEVIAGIAGGIPGSDDADPRDWIAYLLTDEHEGIGFPDAMLGAMDLYSSYARANGLLISQALTQQQAASRVLEDLALATNADFRWSGGVLDLVPYGDAAVSLGQANQANEVHVVPATPFEVAVDQAATFIADVGVRYTVAGTALARVTGIPSGGEYAVDQSTGVYTFAAADAAVSVTISYTWAAVASYVPNTTPVYDLVDDDYLPGDNGPIEINRKPRVQVINVVKLEYLDRENDYNPVAIDAKDEAGILAYGKRPSDLRSCHQFALGSAASLSAALQLNREQVIATFKFKLGPWAILADVMDLLTLTREPMNMLRRGVRVIEIAEDEDGSLEFTCEEYLGTATAPAYGKQATDGYSRDINAAPGDINPPLIFEPTAELLGGATLQIWGAISGQNHDVWGGYNTYASFDGGESYALVGQPVRGPARMGVLTAPLPSVAVNVTGQTIDTTSTLAVDLSESGSSLGAATQADVLALATACYIDGEVVAYRDATLTGPNAYDLEYLVRGAYGTEAEIATHAEGSQIARLDQGIFRTPFDQTIIGQTIYLKFQSFNQFGGGLQDLADLAAYPYTITGIALKSPLATVQNVRTQFTDGFQYIYWDDVTDFRTGIRYKIYKGATYAGAQQVGDNAHAPFIAFGPGTYWIVAYCQPVPGLYVYSEDPVSITIAGNMLVKNLVYASDQAAAGWPGIMSNGVGRDGVNIRLGGGGNILDAPDFLSLPDVLNYGGIIESGTYEVLPADYVHVGYTADCYVNVTWTGVGQPRGQDVLTMSDFLNQPDVLGSASTQYINVKVQIATALGTVGDLYDSADLYAEIDLYTQGIAWTDWVDYVPGVYRADWIKFRLVLTTVDGNTTAIAITFAYEVSIPPRIDHYPDNDVGTGGLTITFEPDDASEAAAFNGGPPVGGVANQPLPFVNFSWSNNADATPVIDDLTLSTLTFHFEDSGGSNVAVDNVNVTAEGY